MTPDLETHGPTARFVHPTDLGLTALLLAICGFLYRETAQFEEVSNVFAQGIPPEFFPRLLIWCIGLLALALPFEHRLLARQGRDIDADRRQSIGRRPIATAALLAAIVALIPTLGTLLAMIAVCLALLWLWGERRLVVLLPFAAIFPGLVAALFAGVLGIHFEAGILGFMLN